MRRRIRTRTEYCEVIPIIAVIVRAWAVYFVVPRAKLFSGRYNYAMEKQPIVKWFNNLTWLIPVLLGVAALNIWYGNLLGPTGNETKIFAVLIIWLMIPLVPTYLVIMALYFRSKDSTEIGKTVGMVMLVVIMVALVKIWSLVK
jgi:hypothetical protein